ncbi:OmpA family protein [Paucibacter sp. R3-3]|uniref:OmpA family protein n=1 Tax=Roseateles agri TaxID=3098619 RepID=A0ABU5DMK1_9BURK|nr:OmpA family protein [Paucibacter sp. R3-3]MDY0747536.1 OmpA family protein [Paucibacter sp. R3-3]
MNTSRISLLAAVALVMTACGTVPNRSAALDQARNRFNDASGDQQVAVLAPDELRVAGDSLHRAEQAWGEGATLSRVDHLAYLTSQRVTIARDAASSRADQQLLAGAGAERDKLRLAQRTDEADQAQRKLAMSERDNAIKTADLAAADAASQQDKARSAERIHRRDAHVADLEMQLEALNAKKTDRGMILTLGDVLFDSGKAQLLPDGSRNMAKLADFFNRNPDNTASIEGYTDSVGSSSSNRDLSQRRADAVKAVLVGLGVNAGHLSTKAHGEEMPTSTNDTPAGRQMNRRVEIVFARQADEIPVK